MPRVAAADLKGLTYYILCSIAFDHTGQNRTRQKAGCSCSVLVFTVPRRSVRFKMVSQRLGGQGNTTPTLRLCLPVSLGVASNTTPIDWRLNSQCRWSTRATEHWQTGWTQGTEHWSNNWTQDGRGPWATQAMTPSLHKRPKCEKHHSLFRVCMVENESWMVSWGNVLSRYLCVIPQDWFQVTLTLLEWRRVSSQ